MSDTGTVLNRTERLIAATAATLLVGGLVSAATVTPVALNASSPLEAQPTPSGAPVPSAAPRPVAGPVTPTAARPVVHAPVGPAKPQAGCPVPRKANGKPFVPKPLGAPIVADADLPPALPPTARASSLAAVSGKGVWVTNWAESDVDVPGIVARAKAAGLHSVWVRTGGSKQGYYGATILPRLVPAAHAAGLSVVAWDFPFLSDPVADAQRAKTALAAGIDAFAPDVETHYEGTFATTQRVTLYLSLVRSYAGDRVIAATVPRPTPKRLASFPYAAFAPYADVFAPMIYWSCNEPGTLVEQSLRQLGRWLPVHPVGQGYDMGREGGRAGLPTYQETLRFLDYARRGGAVGASLWTIEKVGPGQWKALTGYPWPGRVVPGISPTKR